MVDRAFLRALPRQPGSRFGLTEPVLQGWMNEHVPSERRATVLSVRSMFATLGGSIGLVAIGLVARDFGIAAAWFASAAVFALIAPGFLILGRLGGPPSRPAVVLEPEAVPAKVVPPA